MRTLIVTVAKPRLLRSRLSGQVGRRIEAVLADPIWLTHDNDRRESWVSRSGLVRIDAISNEPPATGPLIHRFPSGNAAAWNGYIDDPSFVADDPSPDRVADLPGVFALLAATDAGVTGYTCVHNADSLYLAEGRDVHVISSSARAAHAVAGSTDTAVPFDALIGLAGPGRMLTDATPWPGVVTVPCDSRAVLRPTGVTIARLPAPDIDPLAPVEEVTERFIEALLTAARAVGAVGATVTAQLTGGRDSRLAAAALAAAGVDFTTRTSGKDTDPEAVVAARVSAVLGVHHRVSTGANTTATGGIRLFPMRRVYRGLRGCEGMVNAFDEVEVSQRYSTGALEVGGQSGELLRGGFPIGLGLPADRAVAEAIERLQWQLVPHLKLKLLAPPARERVGEILAPWETLAREDVHRAGEQMALEIGAGRWHAVLRSARSIGGPRREFLIDNQLVRIARAVDQEQAARERLIHAAIHRLQPDLCQVPFLNTRWGFEQDGPTAHCTPELWEGRAPVPTPKGSHWEWRARYPAELQQHFTDTILAAPFFDTLFDRAATQAFLERSLGPERGYTNAKQIWAMYTASQLLNGLGAQPEEPTGPVFEFARPAEA